MTTMELKRSLLQDVESLMGNEQAVKRLQRYVRRLKREQIAEEEQETISKEEILAGIDVGLRDVKEGRTRSAYDLLNEL